MLHARCAVVFWLAVGAILVSAPPGRGEKEKELLKTKARLAFLTPDGKVLTAASKDNVRLVYLDIKKSRLLDKKYQPISLSPDGKVLAAMALAADDDTAVTFYDVATADAKGLVYLPREWAIAFCVAPAGKTCVYGTLKHLVVVDVNTATETHTLKDGGGQPWSTAFSPDGKLLACGTGSHPYQVTVWDTTTWKPVRTFDKVPNVVQDVAFSQDSKLLAVSSDDKVHVWNVTTGKVLHAFQGPPDKLMRGLAFGNHGKVLASACSNGVVTLWDMTTGKARDTIQVGADANHVSMSADGKVLAVTTLDEEMAHVYDTFKQSTARRNGLVQTKGARCGAAGKPDRTQVITGQRVNCLRCACGQYTHPHPLSPQHAGG
jgi:WD40 repeat protein